MPSKTFDLVALAIEVIECQTKAVDCSKEMTRGTRSSGYSLRTWALDVLHLLPDDREDALMIVRAHAPGGVDTDNRRQVNSLCRKYYDRLERTDLMNYGERFLRILN